jgi:hypothetical protein
MYATALFSSAQHSTTKPRISSSASNCWAHWGQLKQNVSTTKLSFPQDIPQAAGQTSLAISLDGIIT